MKEWEKHIRKNRDQAYCGAVIGFVWVFVDEEHARMSMEKESRLHPCPDCLKVLENEKL